MHVYKPSISTAAQSTQPKALTAARKKQIVASFNHRFHGSEGQFLSAKLGSPRAAEPIGMQYASIPAGRTSMSISFGRPISILIPEGLHGMNGDPNKAKQYLVSIGPSTNVRQTQNYGPFKV